MTLYRCAGPLHRLIVVVVALLAFIALVALGAGQADSGGDGRKLFLSQRRAALHQGLVDRPVLTCRLEGELGQFRSPEGMLVSGDRPVAEDVAKPAAEAVAQLGDDFVCSEAIRAREAAVFHQRDLRVVIADQVIAGFIDWRLEPREWRRDHCHRLLAPAEP